MRLNMDVIIDNLSKSYQVKRFGPELRSLSLNRPQLYEPASIFQDGYLYVAHADSLPKKQPMENIALICIGARLPLEWMSGTQQVVQISGTAKTLSVYNEIQRIFDKYDAWDCALRDALEADDDFDVKRIITIGVQVLENPISMTNQTLQVILDSEITSQEDGSLLVTVEDSHEALAIEYCEQVKNVCRIEREISVPYMTAISPDYRRAYCYNLYAMGHFMGCIALSSVHRNFLNSDFALMDHFNGYFRKAFLKRLTFSSNREATFITAINNLLNKEPLNVEERSELALGADERWVCFKLKEPRDENTLPKDYMFATLNALMPGKVYATLFNQEIVGLLRLGADEISPNGNTVAYFCEIINKIGYVAGVSNAFTSIGEFHSYLLQADFAADKGAVESGSDNGRVSFFSECVLSYIMGQCTGAFSAEQLYADGLRTLIAHDEGGKTNYLLTLDTYLKNEMNATKTAKDLYLHRSSLLSRMERIEKLLGADLNDPDFRLYLRICLKLLES